MNLEIKKDLASNWFKTLQDAFCDDICRIEKKNIRFNSTTWKRNIKKDEGGGEYRILQGGKVFDKVGVNFSKVYGKFPKQFQKNIPGAQKDPRFWASGISVVMHMKNPLIPAMHFNTRYICTTQNWFGGGMDVTPSKIDKTEKNEFHKILRNMCNRHNKNYYTKYKKWCDDYFYLSHRDEQRGIGGLFFDDLNEGGFDSCFEFMKSIGNHFIEAYKPIVLKRQETPYTEKQKDFQLFRRGRYVEFNLVQDRGTLFGLQSGGRTESILMSLPPKVKWIYQFNISPNSEEEKLTNYYLKPRDWIS
jgi:coproporphyrinogen III oxidase